MVYTPDVVRESIQIKNKLIRNTLSEFVGTFLLMLIGLSINAQFILTRETLNTWINVNVGWGFAITFSVYPVCKLSGGHLNPAISLLLFSMGDLDLILLPLYIVAQMLGAFCGAAATYLVYIDAIHGFDEGRRAVSGPNRTANIFSTYPAAHLSIVGAFVDQIVGTGLLAFFVVSIIDKRNRIPSASHPLLFGLALIMLGTAFGMNVGYPLNPARDFGPRVFSLIFYGSEVFTYPVSYWFLCPIIAPTVGAMLGGWLYHILLGAHVPDSTTPSIVMEGQPPAQPQNPAGSPPASPPAPAAAPPPPAAAAAIGAAPPTL